MRQWHPIFAQLLRPAVEAYYDIQTTVPVGDAPREADILLLRRTSAGAPPFQGLWRHLTRWNILEFKGPTVSPRQGDIDRLLELGLGIDRRLRSQHRPWRSLPREQVSFWYLANRLGRRFFRDVQQVFGQPEAVGPGLWRSRAVGRLLWWVSSSELPVEEDSLPLHLLSRESPEREREVARLVVEQPRLQTRYGGWMASLHPTAWKEVEAMARTARKGLQIDFRPAIETLGLEYVLEQVGIDRVVNTVGIDRVINTVGIHRVVDKVGIDRVIKEIGPDRVLEQLGDKEVIKRIGLDRILANLSAAERRELKRRLQ